MPLDMLLAREIEDISTKISACAVTLRPEDTVLEQLNESLGASFWGVGYFLARDTVDDVERLIGKYGNEQEKKDFYQWQRFYWAVHDSLDIAALAAEVGEVPTMQYYLHLAKEKAASVGSILDNSLQNSLAESGYQMAVNNALKTKDVDKRGILLREMNANYICDGIIQYEEFYNFLLQGGYLASESVPVRELRAMAAGQHPKT